MENLIKLLLANRPAQVTPQAQPNITGDPSQMRVSYGSNTPMPQSQIDINHALEMNRQQSTNPANWPGYQQAKAEGRFNPPSTIDTKALMEIIMKLLSGGRNLLR